MNFLKKLFGSAEQTPTTVRPDMLADGPQAKKESGNFARFLMVAVLGQGGTRKNRNASLPELSATWSHKSSGGAVRFSTVIVVSGCSFDSIASVLRGLYDEPRFPIAKNVQGLRHGMYSESDIGCSIQFAEMGEGRTEIRIMSRSVSE